MDIRPAKQLWLPIEIQGGLFTSKADTVSPVEDEQVMEQVVERGNLLSALGNVRRNGGSPGIDGMTVEELPEYLKRKWPEIRCQLTSGKYVPLPVKRVEIPKPGGGIRQLGIPTVLDRFIQQTLLQVLQQDWDATFSDSSYGFRPRRSAHQAIEQSQEYLKEGYLWVVDMDLEKFFDRVNHDKLMSEVRKRIPDERVNTLIHRYLRSGIEHEGKLLNPEMGTPQGGPLSPLLANLVLDKLDRELERRGHRFVRYADDCNIYVKSKRAGLRVLKSISGYLNRQLKLLVNKAKSAVDRPWKRQFLGFTFSSKLNRRISTKSLKRFKERVREITCRRELDSWVKRRLRCYLWKQWGRRGYRELRKLGVSIDLAWNTAKSAHGPWRLSRSPGLAFALPAKYFAELGLPRLFVKST